MGSLDLVKNVRSYLPAREAWIWAACIFAGFVLARFGFFSPRSPTGISYFWYPNAILMVGLLRHFGRWKDMLLMIAAFVSAAFTDVLSYQYNPLNLLAIIPANLVEVLFISGCLYKIAGNKYNIENGYRAGAWIVTILIGSTISSIIFGVISGNVPDSIFKQDTPVSAGIDWLLGDAVGYMVVGTLALILTDRRMKAYWVERFRKRRLECILLTTATILAVILSFMGPEVITGPDPQLHHSGYLFICLPFFIWSAFRFGLPGAIFSIAGSAIPAVYVTSFGYGPFAHGGDQVSVNELQLLLVVLSSTVLLTGALIHALEIEKAKTEQANEAKTRFLSALGHEIRTPLNGVLGSAQLLMNEIPPDADPDNKLQLISDSGILLAQLVEDLLNFADLGANGVALNETDFDLVRGVQDTAELFRKEAAEKDLDLIIHLEERDHLIIHSDDMRIRQVLLNLISNAIKFTHEGFVGVNVRVVKRVEDIRIQICVEDTGPGLTKKKRDTIFEPFSGQMGSGLGLGLTICREIAKAMKGSLTVQDRIGGGLIFVFEFRAGYPEIMTHSKTRQTPDALPPTRVLLAEDHEGNTRIMTAMLTALNAQVYHVPDGQKAIDAFQEHEFDLVLMDVQMPVLDGETAVERIRQIESQSALDIIRRTPIVIVSAHAQSGDINRFLKLGADGFLPKPVTPHQLSEVVLKNLKPKSLLTVL